MFQGEIIKERKFTEEHILSLTWDMLPVKKKKSYYQVVKYLSRGVMIFS